jgi:vitamin B12 transporter
MVKRGVILLVLLIIPYSECFGNENIYPIVITSSRIEEPLNRVGSSFTLISNKDVEIRKDINVSDVLRNIPGVTIQQSGTIGEQTFLRMRGGETDYTLFMIDGIKLNSPWMGVFDLADFTWDNIERIEVLRGGASSLYGADAMSGVVNIITKRGRGKRKFSVSNESGNLRTFREKVLLEGESNLFNYSFSFSHMRTGGQFERDSYRNVTSSSNIGFNPSISSSINIITRYIDSRKDLAIDFPFSLFPKIHLFFDDNYFLRKRYLINSVIYKQYISQRYNFIVKLGFLNNRLKLNNPEDINVPYIPNIDFGNLHEKRIIFGIQNNLKLFDFNTIVTGIEIERERVDWRDWGNLFFGKLQFNRVNKMRRNIGLFLNSIYSFDNLSSNISFRFDDNSDYGDNFTPRFSFSYYMLDNTRIKGGFGKGFKVPTFQELYFPIFGNKDLKAEKSRSYDIGLETNLLGGIISIEAIYFYNHFKDIIDIDPKTIKAVNIKKSRTNGLEFIMRFIPSNSFSIEANHTYLLTKDNFTGKELPRRPKNSMNIHTEYLQNKFTFNLDINIRSSQLENIDIIGLNGNLLKGRNSGYTKVDLATEYELFKNIYISGRIDNLFNRNYYELKGYRAPGINFSIGIKGIF